MGRMRKVDRCLTFPLIFALPQTALDHLCQTLLVELLRSHYCCYQRLPRRCRFPSSQRVRKPAPDRSRLRLYRSKQMHQVQFRPLRSRKRNRLHPLFRSSLNSLKKPTKPRSRPSRGCCFGTLGSICGVCWRTRMRSQSFEGGNQSAFGYVGMSSQDGD